MVVSNESSGRQRSEREESSVRARGIGIGRTEKNQRSDEEALDPVRKGWGELGESKMETEVEVKMACRLGRRRRGEIPTREWDREESGRK